MRARYLTPKTIISTVHFPAHNTQNCAAFAGKEIRAKQVIEVGGERKQGWRLKEWQIDIRCGNDR